MTPPTVPKGAAIKGIPNSLGPPRELPHDGPKTYAIPTVCPQPFYTRARGHCLAKLLASGLHATAHKHQGARGCAKQQDERPAHGQR